MQIVVVVDFCPKIYSNILFLFLFFLPTVLCIRPVKPFFGFRLKSEYSQTSFLEQLLR